MRLNKYVAQSTGLSRRAADAAIAAGRVKINQKTAQLGDTAAIGATVTLDDRAITPSVKTLTVMLNKPVGYVCSRRGQGSQTVYDLLPPELQQLKLVGRLDKDSSGLLLLTNDGDLANRLTHPRYGKTKLYQVRLNKPLAPEHQQQIERGVQLEDGSSRLKLDRPNDRQTSWQITMYEGRNRQIRRTFAQVGYRVVQLHRTQFGAYKLDRLMTGKYRQVASAASALEKDS